jgi:hypothetical protein
VNQLAVLGGSLAAILVLAAVAWMLRLGGGAIGGEAEAMRVAEEILSGFEADRAVLGSDGQAALVYGRDGSVALLKVHGAQVAGRRLRPPLDLSPSSEGLRIASGERRFGAVTLRGVETLSESAPGSARSA